MVFKCDFGAFAFARAENYGCLRPSHVCGRAATMSVALETESAPAQLCSDKEPCGRSDDSQGCHLLPIHKRNIAFCWFCATDVFKVCLAEALLKAFAARFY
jgi:hypothetical protein